MLLCPFIWRPNHYSKFIYIKKQVYKRCSYHFAVGGRLFFLAEVLEARGEEHFAGDDELQGPQTDEDPEDNDRKRYDLVSPG